MINTDIIREALADPDNPWHGTELAARILDLCDEHDRLDTEAFDLRRYKYCDCGGRYLKDVPQHVAWCRWRQMEEEG